MAPSASVRIGGGGGGGATPKSRTRESAAFFHRCLPGMRRLTDSSHQAIRRRVEIDRGRGWPRRACVLTLSHAEAGWARFASSAVRRLTSPSALRRRGPRLPSTTGFRQGESHALLLERLAALRGGPCAHGFSRHSTRRRSGDNMAMLRSTFGDSGFEIRKNPSPRTGVVEVHLSLTPVPSDRRCGDGPTPRNYRPRRNRSAPCWRAGGGRRHRRVPDPPQDGGRIPCTHSGAAGFAGLSISRQPSTRMNLTEISGGGPSAREIFRAKSNWRLLSGAVPPLSVSSRSV